MSEEISLETKDVETDAEFDQAPPGDGGEPGGDGLPFKCKIRVKQGNEFVEIDSDADFYGLIGDDILDTQIEIAYGANEQADHWYNKAGTVEQLLQKLSLFERGAKEGPGLLQGACVVSPCDRKAENQRANCIKMGDHDSGETIDEIADKIGQTALFVVIWTTHSHLKTETEIKQKALAPWRKKRNLVGPVTNQDLANYLMEEKGVLPRIFAELKDPDKEARSAHPKGGVTYFLTHAPWPRARSLFLLKDPFVFAARNGGDQQATIVEWRERYAGFASQLGLSFDSRCTDPSRLMYLPRIPATAQIGKGHHEIRVLPGEKLDLDKVERLSTGRGENPRAGSSERTAGSTQDNFVTPNLKKFLAVAAKDFEAAAWMEDHHPDGVTRRNCNIPGIDFECPNAAAHTPKKNGGPDTGFHVANASDNTDGTGFKMWCLHSCPSDKDRAWFLDRALQNYGITDAMSLISPEWTPEVWKLQEADKESQKAAAAEIAEKIAALNEESTVEVIEAILQLMAKRPAGCETTKTFARSRRRPIGMPIPCAGS